MSYSVADVLKKHIAASNDYRLFLQNMVYISATEPWAHFKYVTYKYLHPVQGSMRNLDDYHFRLRLSRFIESNESNKIFYKVSLC